MGRAPLLELGFGLITWLLLAQVRLFADGLVTSANCGFENNMCDWTQATDDTFNWKRKTGPTPTSKTGPSSAKQGAYYIYMEVSQRTKGDTVRLNSPEFSEVTSSGRCMTFSYSMYGSNVGKLRIYRRLSSGTEEKVFDREGNHRNGWHDAKVSLSGYTGTYTLVIEGTRGNGYKGDIAVDDINFQEQDCEELPCGEQTGSLKRRDDVSANPKFGLEKRIMEGDLAAHDQLPWVVRLYITINTPTGGMVKNCGGTLIDKWWVLSAAHCLEDAPTSTRVTNPGKIMLYFGQLNKVSYEEPAFSMKAGQVIVHNQRTTYSQGPHDLVLIKLKAPLTMSSHVNRVCLPDASAVFSTDTECTIAGWGKLGDGTGAYATDLNYVNLKVRDISMCNTEFGSSHVPEKTMCAKSDVQATPCQGDSGGPLACADSTGKYVLAGVLSGGGSCSPSVNVQPTVYADVAKYRDWIDATMTGN